MDSTIKYKVTGNVYGRTVKDGDSDVANKYDKPEEFLYNSAAEDEETARNDALKSITKYGYVTDSVDKFKVTCCSKPIENAKPKTALRKSSKTESNKSKTTNNVKRKTAKGKGE